MRWIVFAALCCAGCSNAASTAPTSVATPASTPAAPAAAATITGHLSATNGGQPLGGVSVDLGAPPVVTDSGGTFHSTVAASPSMRAALTGSAILPRTLYLAASATRDVSLDAIALGGGFDLDFYRLLVRNGYEMPAQLQPLRRLTHAPRVYVRTIDEAGQPIDATTLQTVIDAVWSVGSSWTGGLFGIADVSSGAGDRTGQPGWLTVKWLNPLQSGGFCGQSVVAQDGGAIELNYLTGAGCSCNGSKIRPATIRHELGHSFGFWHTGNASDLLSGLGTQCNQQPSARELYHAAIAYRRPIGNVDPDEDPTASVNLAPMKVR